jgi:hypothetical protein
MRRASGPEPVTAFGKLRVPPRLQDLHHRLLHHPVPGIDDPDLRVFPARRKAQKPNLLLEVARLCDEPGSPRVAAKIQILHGFGVFFERWIRVSADDVGMAWSGVRWVPHDHGIPTSAVQICNFDTWGSAGSYTVRHGLTAIDEEEPGVILIR